jgi:serine/threonine-protein kinase
MAPEQVAADARVDHRADIYALGVMAYEMLTGQQPFAGMSAQAVLAAHLTRTPEPITQLRPAVSGELDALVMRCLAKEPADREGSASELRRSVEALLLRETASIPRAGTPESRGRTATGAGGPRWWPVAAVMVSLAVVAVVFLWRGGVPWRATAPVARRSVVVLPFVNASSDPENEYVSDGVTDELIDALTRVPGLHVPSRSSSFAFKGSQLGAEAIGDSLGVQLVLEGSVRRAGNQLRITTQLSRVGSGSVIWSGRYDRELRDVLALQEEVARSILGAVEATIGGDSLLAGTGTGRGEGASLVRHRTADHVAYDLYLRGRYFWNRRSRDGLTRAASYFEQAIARDSTFAAAWAGLADSYCILANFGHRPAREVCPRSAAAAQRALQLDSTLAEAHASRGFVHLFHDWDLPAAQRELERAVRLDSTYTPAYLWLNHLAWARGDTATALRHMRRAVQLEPLSLIANTRLAVALWRAGRSGEADRQVRYTLELDSTFADAWRTVALLHLERGRFDEAIAAIKREGDRGWLAYMYARTGRRAEAQRIARELAVGTGWVSPLRMGYLYDALGDGDAALRWFERAYDAREPDMIFLGTEPLLSTLVGDPHLRALVRRVGARGA